MDCLLRGKRFYCREWALSKLVHSLDSRPSSKTCGVLITGGPGCGKTGLFSEVVWPTSNHARQKSLRKRLLAAHFLNPFESRTLSVTGFILSLVHQLARSDAIPGYAERLKEPEIQAALQVAQCDREPDEAFKKAVLFPLLELEPTPQKCYFILVDSVDRGIPNSHGPIADHTGPSRSIAELLGKHHHLFPNWLLLVCSARRQSKAVTRLFTGFRKISLDDLRKSQVVRDVQQYILSRLDQDEAVRQHLTRETAEMLNQLHIKSNGCFLYLEKVLDGVGENLINLREIKEIPGTLNGLYLWLCQRLFTRKQFSKVQPLINVILASLHPLTEEEIYECVRTHNVHMNMEDFQRRLNLLKRVLVNDDDAVILFHPSFAEWLQDVKHCTQKYLCDVSDGHAMLTLWHSERATDLVDDEVQELAWHLTRMNPPAPMSWQSYHSVLWLLCGGVPVEDSLVDLIPKDPKVVRLLQDAGARMPEVDDSEMSRSELDEMKRSAEEDPLNELLSSGVDLNLPDANQRTMLHQASSDGNIHLVNVLISKSVDIDPLDKEGQTPLSLAAKQGHGAVVESLLGAGANPDHADEDGWTALRSAAWAGHFPVVDALLRWGASVDYADADHRTALRAAAWGGHEDVVRRLVDAGAEVDRADQEGRTALIAAAYMGHSEIVDFLLERGANVDHEDVDGRTALSVAALCVPANEGYRSVVRTLLQRGAHVDHQDKDGMTPLLVAAFEGHKEICELLLEFKADVDHADKAGRTGLWAAASMGHAHVVDLLLTWSAYVDSIDSEGRTVLSVAAAQGSREVVRLLLDRGLDEMHRDNGGWAPLHYAAFEGHADVCKELIAAGSKVNEVDNEGRDAMILAAQEGHQSVVSALYETGASVDHRSHDGRSALRVAALHGHKEVLRFLAANRAPLDYKDADGRSTIYVLALENKLSMASFLTECGADLESVDSEGRTPLHVAAWQGHASMVELLLESGADPGATDKGGRTALHAAAWRGHAHVLKTLLQRSVGLSVDKACRQGATALGVAAQEGHAHCVRVLLEHGADPRKTDPQGRTPLKVALKAGHDMVARILEEHLEQGRKSPIYSTTSIPRLQPRPQGVNGSVQVTSPVNGVNGEENGSPEDSPESTCDKRRSFIGSLGGNNTSCSSSGGKSLTGGSTGSQQDGNGGLSFTQQCSQRAGRRRSHQVQGKGGCMSPIYATPPITPEEENPAHNQAPHISDHMRIILGLGKEPPLLKSKSKNGFVSSGTNNGGLGVKGKGARAAAAGLLHLGRQVKALALNKRETPL